MKPFLALLVFCIGCLLIALAGWMVWRPMGALILGLELVAAGALAYLDCARGERRERG